MAYPYKRRRPSIVRNFWVYRRLIALAMVLGLMLWFIWANNEPVDRRLPVPAGQAFRDPSDSSSSSAPWSARS